MLTTGPKSAPDQPQKKAPVIALLIRVDSILTRLRFLWLLSVCFTMLFCPLHILWYAIGHSPPLQPLPLKIEERGFGGY
jgi:hypothetical protein